MIAQERSKYRQKNVFRIILPIPLEIVGRQGILQHPREDYMIIGSKDSMVSSAAMLFVYLSFYYLSAHQNSIPLLKKVDGRISCIRVAYVPLCLYGMLDCPRDKN